MVYLVLQLPCVSMLEEMSQQGARRVLQCKGDDGKLTIFLYGTHYELSLKTVRGMNIKQHNYGVEDD